MQIQLLSVQGDDRWEAYHSIRRLVLYELRGRSDYDAAHPDEYLINHFPLLFSADGIPVGTARLDITDEGNTIGTVRLLAVLPQYQRQGVGRAMMRELETFAAMKGVRQLRVHAAHDAVKFYKKLDWNTVDANPRNSLMTKLIS